MRNGQVYLWDIILLNDAMVLGVFGYSLLKVQDRLLRRFPSLLIADSHDLENVTDLTVILKRLIQLPNHLHHMVNVLNAEAGDLCRRLGSKLPGQRTIGMARSSDEMATVATGSSAHECPRLQNGDMGIFGGRVLQ